MLFSWRHPFSKAIFVSVSSIFEYHSAPDHSSTLIAFICITSSSGICEHHNIPKPYRCVGPLTTVSLTRRWRLTAYFRRYFLIKSKKQTNCKLLLQGGGNQKNQKVEFSGVLGVDTIFLRLASWNLPPFLLDKETDAVD